MDRLWAMEVFCKIVEAGSLSRAAAHLDLANASVTTCLRNLETHLGVTLILRNTRQMRMTDEGAAYYTRCKDILAQVDEAEALGPRARPSLHGALRIDVPIAIGHLMLAPNLAPFAEQHPDLRLSVSLSNNADNLLAAGVDVAIRLDSVDDGDLVARWIFEDEHVLCASPAFLSRAGTPDTPKIIPPKQCLGYIVNVLGQPRRWTFSQGNARVDIDPTGNLHFNSSDALLQSAVRNGGFIYVLRVFARGYLEREELVEVLPEWTTSKQTFYAVYRQSRYVAPKIRLFLDYLSNNVFNRAPNATSIMTPRIVPRKIGKA